MSEYLNITDFTHFVNELQLLPFKYDFPNVL